MSTSTESTSTSTESGATMSIKIKAREFARIMRAVAPHASTDKSLPLLMGTRVDVDDGELRVMATDRYTVGTAAMPVEDAEAEFGFTVPREDARDIVKTYGKADELLMVTITVDGDRVTVSDDYAGGARTFLAVEGNYPPVSRIIDQWQPATELAGPVGLNADFLTRFAYRHLADGANQRHSPIITEHGKSGKTGNGGPMRVTYGPLPTFVGLIMPVRIATD